MEGFEQILNAPVVFGLEAQGHIPTIERMLDEQKTWDEIGKEIGWCPRTAMEHYYSWRTGRCDRKGCHEREVTQGMCAAHAILCPKCQEHPCNPDVPDPECNVCIMAYRPETLEQEE